jgi:hypothetical protein
MVQSFELRLLLLEDNSVICQNMHSKASHTLRPELVAAARQLIEHVYPVPRPPKSNGIKPPERSAELAGRAAFNDQMMIYPMGSGLVKFLREVALFQDGISPRDIAKVLDANIKSCAGNMSKLHRNGYVKMVTKGKYMATPEAHLFLQEQS